MQWPACVNQGPVPMHERLRTELRSRGSWRPVDEITCFWSDLTIAMLVMLTKGDDGSKGDVQRHGQAACKTRSARPTETCVPLLMQVEKLSLGEFCFSLVLYVPKVILHGSPQAKESACTHGSVGFSLVHLSAPQPQQSAPNSFSPFAPHNARGIAAATAPHGTALHCTALHCEQLSRFANNSDPRSTQAPQSPGLPFACAVRPPITSPSAFVEFLAAVATPQRV